MLNKFSPNINNEYIPFFVDIRSMVMVEHIQTRSYRFPTTYVI